ncbi:hypothetical protein NLI96_g10301 [Meripilus lineatus]|uniref:Ribosomal RNA-processing protein 17 n=1 Tax=Meripilus lineatus TaxID=2056292 RepID=A0AAD5UVD3_9APHY|nr:hypothetical protein NLI96_g10301 [Physisporinus lineatus]
MSNNLATLTKSHNIVALKKRAKREQIKEIVFDEYARKDFLTGFHKRKVQQKEEAKRKAREREKNERLEARREKRRMLAEKAAQNAEEVERAYGAIVDGDDESTVFSEQDKGKQRAAEVEDEYEDEEQLATVTIVEDFDPHELLHGPQNVRVHQDVVAEDSDGPPISTSARHTSTRLGAQMPSSSKKPQSRVAKKPKEIKYQTQVARKIERAKQRRRSTEKAERAGGKAARRKGSKRNQR